MAAELNLLAAARAPRAGEPRRRPRRAKHARSAGPFMEWVEQRIARYDRLEARKARERGLSEHRPVGLGQVLSDIGWLRDAEVRRMRRWRTGQPGAGAYIDKATGGLMLPADEVEAALEHADVAVWEIYPEATPAADSNGERESFCPACSEEVLVIDGACAWCETPLGERPHTIAARRAPRRRARPRGQTRRRRHKPTRSPRSGAPRPPDPLAHLAAAPEPAAVWQVRHGLPETFVREAMRAHLQCDLSMLDAARVLLERYPGRWARPETLRDGLRLCFEKRGVLVDGDRRTVRARPDLLARERARIEEYLRTPDPGYAYRGPIPPEAVWEAAWRYYLDGYGFLRIARLLKARSPQLTRSGERTLASRLHDAFRTNGWPTRPQAQASRAANWRHGLTAGGERAEYERYSSRALNGGTRPHCDAISKQTGRPCANFAMRGESKCWAHSQRTEQTRTALLQAGHLVTQRELVDSRPFVTWLAGRVSSYGTLIAASRVLEINRSMLSQILSTGGTSHPGKLTRRLIERSLQAALRNDPDLLVPRFSDLYDTAPKADAELPSTDGRASTAAGQEHGALARAA